LIDKGDDEDSNTNFQRAASYNGEGQQHEMLSDENEGRIKSDHENHHHYQSLQN